MQGITAGELRLTGGFGIRQILGFSMREYPGEHARAEVTGRVEAQEGAIPELLGQIKNSRVELHAAGEKRAVYSGMVQGAESLEENGYRLLRLELWSGSVLMDLKREKRSFQDPSMTYGQLITGITSEAGMSALYPRELDETETGFPVIQYRETDWEFIRRLASRFGLAVYPEPTMEGGKVSIGLPETGFSGPLSSLSDSVGIDRKFYEAGGERTGRERRNYRTVEVRSLELRRIGDVAEWKGTPLYVCAREGELRGGILEFRYVLAGKEWTWQKRLGNPRISGMSLLGTVAGCTGETVRLDLDIDRGRAARERYPWRWVPATGNLMYMMPQKGTRVSLYFKGDEETDAIAVNCIRSGEGCTGADYRDKSLVTEQGMELRLHRGDMGVVSLKEKVLLDDLEGIRIGGSGGLHILAAGEVKIDGAEVRVEGTEGVYLYEGEAKADEEGTVSVTVKGKVELSADEEGSAVHSRGENVTYYLAWERMDLSHPSNRYRDEPEQKDYDWAKWRMNIVSGVAVAAGVAVLAASGVGFLVGTGVVSVGGATGAVTAAGAAKATGMAVFLTGSLYVAEQAVSDAVSGRLSETEQYARKALAGSVVGFLTGASGLLMQGSGLGKVLALGFGEGFLGSAATQALLNEDGEINWALAFWEGMFSAAVTGMAWKIGGSIKRIEGGSDVLEDSGTTNLLDDMGRFTNDKLENDYQVYVKRKTKKGQIPKARLEWKEASDYWTKQSPIARGNNFNETVQDAGLYDYYEIYLENGKRLDSYDPDAGEIISRKATDLDKITEETYRRYLAEFSQKYAEGTKIRSNKYPELDGQELKGQYILEIPASNANISNIDYYKEIAAEYDVILRFTEETR